MKFLVVDDNIESAEGISSAVTQMSHGAAASYTDAAVLELATQTRFHVLLCDVNYPTATGLNYLGNCVHKASSQDACMIAVTGRTDLGAKDFEACDGYQYKPITWPALKQALDMWVVIEPPPSSIVQAQQDVPHIETQLSGELTSSGPEP